MPYDIFPRVKPRNHEDRVMTMITTPHYPARITISSQWLASEHQHCVEWTDSTWTWMEDADDDKPEENQCTSCMSMTNTPPE